MEELTCQTHKESATQTKKLQGQNRFGGILLATSPDGYIIHCDQFVGCEAIPLRYFFLASICAGVAEVKCIIHDDACHLARYADKHAGASGGAKTTPEMVALWSGLQGLTYVLDRFHSSSHKDPWCLRTCHPDVHKDIYFLFALNMSMC